MLKSLKDFVMGLLDGIRMHREYQAKRYTRDYRLNQYIQSKGCQDASCVEHWIKEFERKEARYGL